MPRAPCRAPVAQKREWWLVLRRSSRRDIMRNKVSVAALGAAAFALALSGCDKAGAGKADPESIKQAIKADEAKWNKEFKAKDTEALAGHYANDAYLVVGGEAAEGSTAIRQVFATASTDPAFAVTFASDRIDVA